MQQPAEEPVIQKALDANFFRVRHDRMTPLQQKYLRAIAELGEGSHPMGRIADNLGVEPMAVGASRVSGNAAVKMPVD